MRIAPYQRGRKPWKAPGELGAGVEGPSGGGASNECGASARWLRSPARSPASSPGESWGDDDHLLADLNDAVRSGRAVPDRFVEVGKAAFEGAGLKVEVEVSAAPIVGQVIPPLAGPSRFGPTAPSLARCRWTRGARSISVLCRTGPSA